MNKICALGSFVAVLLCLVTPSYYFLVSPPLPLTTSLGNKRPVIGVVVQKDGKRGKYVVFSNYVKALEGSGAKVVPVWINEDPSYYRDMIKSLNGLVFPGGSADLLDPTDIGGAGQILYELAEKLNDEGVHFPILGVCQGFQLLATASARQKIVVSCNETIFDNLPVRFIENPSQSYLFGRAPQQVVEILENQAITPNIHSLCITRDNLNRMGLSSTWKVLSSDYTKLGLEYVTSMEHTRYPFAGVQFHPEKSIYDLSENSRYISNYTAVFANRWFYDWIVMEARMNDNSFPNSTTTNDRIIDRFCPMLITSRMGSTPQVSVLKGTSRPLVMGADYSRLHILFTRNADSFPSHPAFIYEDIRGNVKETNYKEAEEISNKLARAILAAVSRDFTGFPKGNADGDFIIAVALPPSDDLVLTLLAVWKAGAAYLPLDAASPRDRTKHILNESKPILIITQTGNESDTAFGNIPALSYERLLSLSESLSALQLREDEILTSSLEDPIEMVLYTSGSTGLSKGVRVKKSSVLNRLQWQWYDVPYFPHEETFVFKTALTFVDSVSEIWGPILCPSDVPRTLLIVPKEITTNPQRLVTLLNKYKIGRLVLVPSLLKAILLYTGLTKDNAGLLNDLKIWICSGEPLAPSLALQFFRSFGTGNHVLYNFYGSTEMMGDVTYHKMNTPDDVTVDNKVPIGVPLDNTAIYLLNNQLQPVPVGEVGELFAAGLNIAAGYVNGRDTNRFIPNPHAVDPDLRFLYRTGDYAKLVKGTLLFEGRTDSQVKVRGHRVDLSEVEAALVKCSEVQKGIVLCHNPGEPDQQIVAFVKLEDGVNGSPYDIEQKMTSGVPKYAIPQVIIVKDMPYLVNGKVDRQTLLRQYRNSKSQNGRSGTGIDLKGLSESDMAAGECLFRTISEVLGSSARGKITKDANFYSLGGNSLNSVLTISLLNEQGYAISVTDFITAKTLGEVVNRMCVTGVANHTSKSQWDKFHLEILEDKHKENAFRIIGDSFYEKADIERTMDPPPERQEFIDLLESVWPYIVKHGASIAVRDKKTKEVVGVSLVMDADDEPTEVNLYGQLRYTMEFLDYIEIPIRDNVLPKGKILHSFMLGTSQDKTSQENIEITECMEEKVLELAREQGYLGIFTTNSSPLTQQLAEVMNYRKLKIYQINEYVAPDGTRPFKRAPDDQLAIVSWRKA